MSRTTPTRLEVLRHLDSGSHAALCSMLPALAEMLSSESDFGELADLLALVAAEAPDAAREFALRLDAMSDALADVNSLRKWALHGLQHYRDDPPARLKFFALHDPLAFADRITEADSAHLLARRDALQHYLAGFGVEPLRIELHEPLAARLPPQAVAIGEGVIRLPRRCAAPEQRELLYRAAVAHAAAHLRFSPLARPAGNRHPKLLALLGLVEDARVERLIVQDYPGLHALWGRFHTATRASAGFDLAGLSARLARALHDPAHEDANAWVMKGRRLFEQAMSEQPHLIAQFEQIGRTLAIDAEKMRLDLPRHYRVQPPYRDDHALLWNLNAALPEDETRTVVREDYEMRPQDEAPSDLRHAEVDPRRRVRHPEWDHRLEALREDWATVFESAPARQHGATPAAARLAPRLRLRGLDRTPDRSIRLNRLREGDELDLNAAIDGAVRQRARLAPDGRIFRRHGRRRRATAIVLLMDLSQSTGRFVPGSFTTVMQVEKRAATLVAQSLDASLDRIAVHGFASNGRHEVNYQVIKAFDEPFGTDQQARLASLQGALSTRMGAALRHASAALDAEAADHKVILMLTDGEPSDIDVVEDDYLVEDARHAVASAAARGIRCFCLTLDRDADNYVRRIFGARNYLIADHADAFAGHTGQTLVRLIAH